MRIAFYQDITNGSVTHHHRMDDDLSDKEIRKKVDEFNEKQDREKVIVLNIWHDKFTRYLIKKCEEKDQIAQDAIDNTQNAINNALDALEEAKAYIEALEH